jgi:hypothetical protein
VNAANGTGTKRRARESMPGVAVASDMRNQVSPVAVTASTHFGRFERGTVTGVADTFHTPRAEPLLQPRIRVPEDSSGRRSSEIVLGVFPEWICIAASDFLHFVVVRYRLCWRLIKQIKSGRKYRQAWSCPTRFDLRSVCGGHGPIALRALSVQGDSRRACFCWVRQRT